VVERDAHFGGNHIWSWFGSDVDGDGAALLQPLMVAGWAGYDIAFPHRRATLSTPYASITSPRLDAVLRAALGARAMAGVAVDDVQARAVVLANGAVLRARAVLDARGLGAEQAAYGGGWQKFVGQRLRLARPHGLARPMVMDARVPQIDGYRFIYVLPLSADTLFVEDTYYSDNPVIDRPAIAARIAQYAAQNGWAITAIEGEESGAVPVVSHGCFDRLWPMEDGIARAGVRAGAFHPTTGYSLPDAVRFAVDCAHAWPHDDAANWDFGQWARAWARRVWAGRAFYRLLDRMLFGAARPDQRWRIFDHFYRLPQPVIERFYAGRSGLVDRLRLLSGRPPVPIMAAVRALLRRA
ncbi:MAG: lycopene beta-cyclase CrtY, partial [Sphingopyxis sp.]